VIKGFTKTTLIDFPKNLASIVFLGDCNFRCDYCYNKSLVEKHDSMQTISEESVLEAISKHKKHIDGVVVSGGEPTIYRERLIKFVKEIKKLDLKVKLDTNGYLPEVLLSLIRDNVVDYFAMDIKADYADYEQVVGCELQLETIINSIRIIQDSGVDHEFRTTVWKDHPIFNSYKILMDLREKTKYYIQKFHAMDLVRTKGDVSRSFVLEWASNIPHLNVNLRSFDDY